MKISHIITASLLATTWVGSNVAYAEGSNPLHPSYFWGKMHVPMALQNSGRAVAIPITNPLHPSYFAVKAMETPFIATGISSTGRYVDNRNPLHPGFRRS